LKDAEESHKCELLESGGLHPPTPAIRGGGRGELPSGGPCGRPVDCQYIWSGGLRNPNSRPPGDPAGSQALRGATEHQNLISATSLVFTTETCILWYVSLGSQHVILFPKLRQVRHNEKLYLCDAKLYLRYAQICVVSHGSEGHFCKFFFFYKLRLDLLSWSCRDCICTRSVCSKCFVTCTTFETSSNLKLSKSKSDLHTFKSFQKRQITIFLGGIKAP